MRQLGNAVDIPGARELDQLGQEARQGNPTAQRELAGVYDEGASGFRRFPDRLDVGHDQSPNLSFAGGIHHRRGAALVRREGRIAFEMLPERSSQIGLLAACPADPEARCPPGRPIPGGSGRYSPRHRHPRPHGQHDPLAREAPVRQARVDPAVAATALGLTGMESQVAVLLGEGMNVREVAAATGRKDSTLRSYVKHMFAKHDLSRQADLVRPVQSLSGAPGSRRCKRKPPRVGVDLVSLSS